jgi:predicted dehydrogenase
MLRIAIVGCGKIADQHVLAIRRIPDCQIVAVCDREILMAEQLSQRFGIDHCFADTEAMLSATKPDIVHVTTPPQSHFPIATQCLERGSHVYIEKPFTVTAQEAETLIRLAGEKGLKITAGHNLQFTLEMLEMRRLVQEGFLGGKPVHLESHFSYDLGDTSYVGPLLGSGSHWVRRLPGQLLHNILSHGIAKLAEFLDEEIIDLVAWGDRSAKLRMLGETEILDELRVLLRDASGTTAFFCFSTQLKPGLNQLCIYGPVNSIIIDHITGSIIRNKTGSYKSYLTYFIPPVIKAQQHLKNARTNMVNFLRRRLYQDFGMKELIARFYDTIRGGGEPPIPYREILLTARIMDRIFTQVYPAPSSNLGSRLNSTVDNRGLRTADGGQMTEVQSGRS